MGSMFVLALALALDWYAGDPDFVWKKLPHPVVLFGRLIEWMDRLRYHERLVDVFGAEPKKTDLLMGWVLLGLLAVISIFTGWLVHSASALLGPLWWLLEVPLVAVLLAQKSLKDHVEAIVAGLRNDGLEGGRLAVARIVGRDVSGLDQNGVARAGIESLAENFSDGVVAPALWYALLGLPGLVFYKAVNTADSMIGHRTHKHEYFGKPAARLDDALNWPAARLTALLVAFAVFLSRGRAHTSEVWATVLRDAPTHASPNAGWPETAFAAAGGVALGGPRSYDGRPINAPTLNGSGRLILETSDIVVALGLFTRCCFILFGLVVLIAIIA